MYAEPTMPNTSLTPCATSVSTNASDGVIFCRPGHGSGSSRACSSCSSWRSLAKSGPQDFQPARAPPLVPERRALSPASVDGGIAKRAPNVYIRRTARSPKTATHGACADAHANRARPTDSQGRIHESSLACDPGGRAGRRAAACAAARWPQTAAGTGQACASRRRCRRRQHLFRAAEADGRPRRQDVGRPREDGDAARRRRRAGVRDPRRGRQGRRRRRLRVDALLVGQEPRRGPVLQSDGRRRRRPRPAVARRLDLRGRRLRPLPQALQRRAEGQRRAALRAADGPGSARLVQDADQRASPTSRR